MLANHQKNAAKKSAIIVVQVHEFIYRTFARLIKIISEKTKMSLVYAHYENLYGEVWMISCGVKPVFPSFAE